MKITVDIGDSWIEEATVEEGLKSAIKQEVIGEIRKLIKTQVEAEITKVVAKEIQDSLQSIVKESTLSFVESGMIMQGGNEISVDAYLKNIFQNSSNWNSPNVIMKDLADKWAKELKNKYDGAFVSQLIQRISDVGLLKPEAAKLLLDTNI